MSVDDQQAQDARVEKLWQTLDTRKEGHLDAKGLKMGLKQIDHRASLNRKNSIILTLH